ncbi:hypothetical protein M1B72_09010 [Geomonas paludis]|uniref:Small CPxCG-related zinc finger protein n=1 Tax=Geomonas paludis TaxID=2740185 RepID=A0ABY4LM28_9BACT|nr:hypothetical protein [Geomonas paludis]UPU37828.1 hypothetical protein M1B72_09010 [Geomonas paludis]
MSEIIEDLFAFLQTTGEPVTCSRCGRQLAEGEPNTLNEDNQVVCPECEEEV